MALADVFKATAGGISHAPKEAGAGKALEQDAPKAAPEMSGDKSDLSSAPSRPFIDGESTAALRETGEENLNNLVSEAEARAEKLTSEATNAETTAANNAKTAEEADEAAAEADKTAADPDASADQKAEAKEDDAEAKAADAQANTSKAQADAEASEAKAAENEAKTDESEVDKMSPEEKAKKALAEKYKAEVDKIDTKKEPKKLENELESTTKKRDALDRAYQDADLKLEAATKRLKNPDISDEEKTAALAQQKSAQADLEDYGPELDHANAKVSALEDRIKKDGGAWLWASNHVNELTIGATVGLPLAYSGYGEVKSLFSGSGGSAGDGSGDPSAGGVSNAGAASDVPLTNPGQPPYNPLTGDPNPNFLASGPGRSITA